MSARAKIEKANREHMDRVRAVHRRSAYERAFYKQCELEYIEKQLGLTETEQRHLSHVRDLLGVIRREMIEHGQLEEAQV